MIKKIIMFIISCFFMFGFGHTPIDIGLTPEANTMIGIFIGAITLWLTVDVGWPSLLVLFSLTQLPGATTANIVSSSLGNNTIAFLIFSCVLTYALSASGILRRIALWFVNRKNHKSTPWQLAIMYFLSILVIGSFIAPTVLFVLYMSLSKEIFKSNRIKPGDEYGRMLMCGTAIMTSISCAMTPIAHTFPLMALGYYETATGNAINWIDYMKIGIPAGLIIAVVTICCLYLGFKDKIANFDMEIMEGMGPIKKEEIISLVVFLGIVFMWLISGVAPDLFPILKTWTTTIPPIFGIVILCLFGVLDFNEALKKGVPWTSIILCGTTLAVGKYLTSEELGITAALGSAIGNVLTNPSADLMIFLIAAFTIIMTNFMSNIVTTTVSYNLMMPIVLTTGVISPELTAILVGMCASMAYATPPAIAHVALAAGSEYCNTKTMLIYGGIASIMSIMFVSLMA